MIEWSGMRALAGAQSEFHDRILATLLFTDLVESTTTLVRVGDVSWGELLALHHQAARSEVERFRGRIVDTAGDGLLAIFDAPARALRCASAIRAAATAHGLQVRAGIHAGEVATVGVTFVALPCTKPPESWRSRLRTKSSSRRQSHP